MRRNVAVFLSAAAVLISLAALLWVVGAVRAGPAANPDLPKAGAPTVVSYQGQVSVDGSPYDGSGFFKFAIVDAAGTTTYWSNDGTSAGGGEPTNGTSLPVANGLFNVLLGDTSLTNMTQPLVPQTFDGTERYLRVWFSTDNINFQQLAPDRRIAAVPYALQAEEAANADTVDGEDADAFADAIHTHDGLVPAGGLVLGRTMSETTLIDAGFSFTGGEVGNAWSTKTAMPTGRHSLAAAAVDSVVYAIGGASSGVTYETANEAYDPATDSWTTKAAMPTGRYGLAAAAVDGIVYAIGGNSAATNYETANEAYDPASDSWDDTLAPMPTGRWLFAAAAVDGVVYAIGGYSSATPAETANEAYDPATDSWDSTLAPMPTGRFGLAAATVDGVIYTIGGWSFGNSYETANEAYYPAVDLWDPALAPMPTGRNHVAAAAVGGVVYAIGGDSSTTSYETANEAYDPATDSWTAKASIPTARQSLAVVLVHGAVYAIGGQSSGAGYETANEAYTPALYVYEKQ